MSHGARNWPFFTLTARPVSPAATRRSVCRQRNAGICSTSTASAAGAHCSARVHVGQHRQAEPLAHLGENLQAPRHADAARGTGAGAVRLVVAATCRSAARPSRRRSRRARRRPPARAPRLSIWHGPAISTNGRSLPISTPPMRTIRGECSDTMCSLVEACDAGDVVKSAKTGLRHGRACPGHPRGPCSAIARVKAWMPGTSPGMTRDSRG